MRECSQGSSTVVPGLLPNAGPLAQLAEQRTFNPRVVGSRPTGPTHLSCGYVFADPPLLAPWAYTWSRIRHRDSGGEQKRGSTMTQVMEADATQPRRLDQLSESFGDPLGINGIAVVLRNTTS